MLKRSLLHIGMVLVVLTLLILGPAFIIPSPAFGVSVDADHIELPTLTATITAPNNGTNVQVGQCFQVNATIRVTCPALITDYSIGPEIFSFIKPVYAVPACACDVSNIKATISIAGSATVQDVAIKSFNDCLTCPSPGCLSEWKVSWNVCCNAPGTVTITVTPYGEVECGGYTNNFQQPDIPLLSDLFVTPVYATEPTWCPLPSDHLISSSITIIQNAKKKTFDDGGNSWSMPPQTTWSKSADIKVTTANTLSTQVIAGQPVTIFANVANRGEADGDYTAKLSINGQVESSRQLMVPANKAIPVEFTVVKAEPGTYLVDINGQKTSFIVTGTVRNEDISSTVPLIGFIFCAFGIIVVIAVILKRRFA